MRNCYCAVRNSPDCYGDAFAAAGNVKLLQMRGQKHADQVEDAYKMDDLIDIMSLHREPSASVWSVCACRTLLMDKTMATADKLANGSEVDIG